MGGAINTLIISLSPSLSPWPAGVDPNPPESLAKGIHLFPPRHFGMPFHAHALGTFAGALAAFPPRSGALTHRRGKQAGYSGWFA